MTLTHDSFEEYPGAMLVHFVLVFIDTQKSLWTSLVDYTAKEIYMSSLWYGEEGIARYTVLQYDIILSAGCVEWEYRQIAD